MASPKLEHASHELEHAEKGHHDQQHYTTSEEELQVFGFETELRDIPKGYYTSKFFLGSMLATGLSLTSGTGAFSLAASILTQINDDLGPDPRYAWISLVYNVCLAVFLAPVGRLSDIFGRRYFFIVGALVMIVGSIVCATAKNIPVLIGGNVLLGVGTSTQLAFHFVMGELVPMKYRYLGLAFLYNFCFPLSGVGPIISFALLNHSKVGWRGVYWVLTAVNGACLVLWAAFYFPPSFDKKHRNDENRSLIYWVKHFDYFGTFLFAAGFVLFLLGLSWGGSVYPWKSAAVISSIVVGFMVLVAFALWETYAPLREPLVPMHLLRNRKWVCNSCVLGLGASVYYSFAIIWPMQAATVYGGQDIQLGALSCIPGIGIIVGQVIGGLLAPYIGKAKLQCAAVLIAGGACVACMATTDQDKRATAIALLFIGTTFIGYNEALALAGTTLLTNDQTEIGIAGGLGSSIRSAITAVVSAVYVTILTNRLAKTVPEQVPPALVAAGLPESSVASFLTALSAGTGFSSVAGITDKIITAGTNAYIHANTDAFDTVYLSSIAFTGLAIVLALLSGNTDDVMNDNIVATLANEDNHLTAKHEGGPRATPSASPSCDTVNTGYQCQPDISHNWGMYSPYFQVPTEIPDVVPPGCTVNFVQLLQRHGARYPTSKKSALYKSMIEQVQASGAQLTGKYAFLKKFDYTMGADDLTDFGQQQSYNAALQFYSRYEHLASAYTPFVRASSEERVVVSALNWTQGFHAAKEAQVRSPGANPYPIGILQLSEADGQNNTLDSSTCPNFENGWESNTSGAAQATFQATFIGLIQARLNRDLPGANLTANQAIYFMDMCPFETVSSSNGAISPFCALFTDAEWQDYNYYETLNKYYADGWGNFLGSTQGVGFVNELLARLTNSQTVDDHTSVNTTLDGSSVTFPVGTGHPLFADFSHDDPMTSIFSALGLYNRTALLSNTTIQTTTDTHGYSAAWTVPFAGRAFIEKQLCVTPQGRFSPDGDTVEYVRIIVNDRVVPLQNCGADQFGRCLLSDFVKSQSYARFGGNWDQCYV